MEENQRKEGGGLQITKLTFFFFLFGKKFCLMLVKRVEDFKQSFVFRRRNLGVVRQFCHGCDVDGLLESFFFEK
jgi:hypothetical protein